MDDGIGRSGVRLVALVFMLIGALGVLVFVNANTDVLERTGMGAIALALVALTIMIFSLTGKSAAPKPAPQPKETWTNVPESDINIELPAPAPKAAPAAEPMIDMVEPAPPQAAPQASHPMPRPAVSPPLDEPENRAHLRERYTQNTQLVKDILDPHAPAQKVPKLKARRWSPRMGDATPAGTTRGRCGQCQSIILAPTARPIDLSCPVCEKVTRLNG